MAGAEAIADAVEREGPDGSSVVIRALSLLHLTASSERPLTLPEISLLLGLPKPTAHRLCARLEELGYLAREPGGRHFRIGPKMSRLGLDIVRNDGLRSERRAILSGLVDVIGETCNLTMLSGSEVLYLDRVESRWPLRLHLEPGSRVPAHCTASGKLFLANLSPARRTRVLDTMELARHTPGTITDRRTLEAELDRIRVEDHGRDDEEFLLGLIAVAVPVRTARGEVLAAIACHAPKARLSLEDAVRHLALLRDAAARIAATLPEP